MGSLTSDILSQTSLDENNILHTIYLLHLPHNILALLDFVSSNKHIKIVWPYMQFIFFKSRALPQATFKVPLHDSRQRPLSFIKWLLFLLIQQTFTAKLSLMLGTPLILILTQMGSFLYIEFYHPLQFYNISLITLLINSSFTLIFSFLLNANITSL